MRNPSEWIDDELADVEQPTPEQSVFRFSLAMVIVSALVFGIANHKSGMDDPGYEVMSVSKGALQVVDRKTGEHTELRNRELVRKALSGQIRRGDVVYE